MCEFTRLPSIFWASIESGMRCWEVGVKKWSESVTCSVVSDSLRSHGWRSLGGYRPYSQTIWLNCSLLGFSVHGVLQARILEWVAIPFSRGSSWPRNWTWISCISGRRFTLWATREVPPNSCWNFKPQYDGHKEWSLWEIIRAVALHPCKTHQRACFSSLHVKTRWEACSL